MDSGSAQSPTIVSAASLLELDLATLVDIVQVWRRALARHVFLHCRTFAHHL